MIVLCLAVASDLLGPDLLGCGYSSQMEDDRDVN